MMAKQLTYQRHECRIAFTLAMVVVLWSGALSASSLSTAKASILLPENGLRSSSALDAEQLIAELEEQESASSGASSTTSQPPGESSSEGGLPTPQKDDLVRQLAALGSHTEGSTSGTSSSPSGSSSTGSGATLLADVAVVLPEDLPARRNAEEQALSLPDAPGTELLRPPQHS